MPFAEAGNEGKLSSTVNLTLKVNLTLYKFGGKCIL
jgi:hypothetical protein